MANMLGQVGSHYPYPFCTPIGLHVSPSSPYGASVNQHIMQGYGNAVEATLNVNDRQREPRKKDANSRGNGKSTAKSPKPKVTCQACFMQGHEAINCWALVRALLTQHFVRNLIDKSILDKVKDNYKLRFQPPENARANKLCHDTLWSYCVDNKVTAEQVCEQMNWKGFVDSRNDTDLDSSDDEDSSDEDRESPDKM